MENRRVELVIVIVLFLLGLVGLVVGGELLVQGASKIAGSFGISPLVIGLTVVAFGTSAPELAVSIQAGLAGKSDIALANVVGSNIFNVLFILGVCALILPLVVSRQLVRREVPIMILVSVLLYLLARDGALAAPDGVLLFAGIIGYTIWSVVASRRANAAVPPESQEPVTIDTLRGREPRWWIAAAAVLLIAGVAGWLGWFQPVAATVMVIGSLVFLLGRALRRDELALQLGFILVGLGTLVQGAGWLIDAATTIAARLGVPDVIIGLTIVAAGTSLPEVATSIIATIRKERDIAIGNVVGSNIFNILSILGLSALVTPGGLTVNPVILEVDLPIMIAVAVACLPVFFNGFSIARWDGALFLGSYIAYTVFLILAATADPAIETFRNAVLLVAPLLVATLVWMTIQGVRKQRAAAAQ
jgi:cation:H+ antiporter